MLRNTLSNWLGLLVVGVISVILTPILIRGLGNFYYGMWILVASVLDYYGLLDLGMRWSLFRFVAHFKGANARSGLNEVLVTALAITAGIMLLVTMLTLAMAVILPGFFNLSGPARHVLQLLVLLSGLSVAVAFPTQLLSAYLRGLQRFDLYNLALIVSAVVRAGLIVAALHFGQGVLGVTVVTLAVAVLSLILNWALMRMADPQLSLDWRQINFARMRQLMSYSFYAFLSTTGEYLRFYTDSAVIGRVLGIALITPFSIASRLMEYFKSVLGAVNGPIMATMSELDGQGRSEELQELFLRGTRITALISLFLASLLLLDGRFLIRLWVGEAYLLSYPLVLILVVGYVASFAQQPCMLIIFARARHYRVLSWWTLAEGIANVLLSVYWAHKYGLIGVALGTSVPLLVVKILIQPWYALQVLQLSARRYLVEGLGRPASVCGVFVALGWLLTPSSTGGGFLRLVWSVGWQGTLFAILAYSIGLVGYERQRLRHHGRQVAAFLLQTRTE